MAVITPDGVGDRGPSGTYTVMSIGDGEKALVWVESQLTSH